MADKYIHQQDAIDDLHTQLMYRMGSDDMKRRLDDWVKTLPSADVVQVVRCKDCIHNNDCDIQYSAQAGDNFFCGFGETEKDVREDIYE